MTQRNKNLRDMVDGMFRQNSPATPQQIVQEVLSDESRDSGRVGSDSSTSLTPKKPTSPLPAAKFVAPETSLTLPAINVVPITTDEPRPIVEEKQGVWQVIATIVLLIAIAVLLWRFYEPIKSWLAETLKLDPTESLIASSPSSTASLIVPATSTVANTVTVVTSPDQLNAEIINNGDNGAKKNVTFDESKNMVRFIDTSAPPAEDAQRSMQIISTPLTTDGNGAVQMTTQATAVIATPEPSNVVQEATLENLQLSLDNLAKNNLDLQAQHDAQLEATNQKEQGRRMRLSELQQFSAVERMAPMVDNDARGNAQKIYERDGGNSVVGNRTMAPFVTFAPGEEPFDGMVPDYDEAEHGSTVSIPPPLEPGKPHGILELINDHCMRTGKPMPKAGDRSTLDIMSKKDTGTHAAMRVAEVDGHYLQSQRKQFELQRMNASAIKKIYADKRAASAGQILDRGDAVQFAGAQDVDAIQYLNVNSL